ncbi:hypothetical protein OCU04_001627 [Sclerotinia nivalis]|uniref:Uncharacterized protein n=1 Tax=Sclerotinia nivalis TaxID=352851 RepID=A0A9X0AYJ1_9HELO|nr:hypothetical protein OCU04_001627 [Sclerotinia nivalis]
MQHLPQQSHLIHTLSSFSTKRIQQISQKKNIETAKMEHVTFYDSEEYISSVDDVRWNERNTAMQEPKLLRETEGDMDIPSIVRYQKGNISNPELIKLVRETEDDMDIPSIVRRQEGNISNPELIKLARETEDDMDIPSIVRYQEGNMSNPGLIKLARETEDDMDIPSIVRRQEGNMSSPGLIKLARETADEIPSAIRYGLRDTPSPEPDSPEPSIINADLFGGTLEFDDLSDHYLELLKVQDALHSKLVTLETLHRELRTEFEVWVQHSRPLKNFLATQRKGKVRV